MICSFFNFEDKEWYQNKQVEKLKAERFMQERFCVFHWYSRYVRISAFKSYSLKKLSLPTPRTPNLSNKCLRPTLKSTNRSLPFDTRHNYIWWKKLRPPFRRYGDSLKFDVRYKTLKPYAVIVVICYAQGCIWTSSFPLSGLVFGLTGAGELPIYAKEGSNFF